MPRPKDAQAIGGCPDWEGALHRGLGLLRSVHVVVGFAAAVAVANGGAADGGGIVVVVETLVTKNSSVPTFRMDF